MPRERSWTIQLDGYEPVSTNDLRLREVAIVEKVSGVPYTLMNPHASVKVATALFVVLAMRGGMPEQAALDYAENLTVEALHGAFEFDPGDQGAPPAADGDVANPPDSAPTSATG